MYTNYESYSAEADNDTDAVVDLIKLYNTWLKQNVFSCTNSGYGTDPQDGNTDVNGVTCSRSNSVDSFKCRVQYRFSRMFNAYAGSNTLTFT